MNNSVTDKFSLENLTNDGIKKTDLADKMLDQAIEEDNIDLQIEKIGEAVSLNLDNEDKQVTEPHKTIWNQQQ
jgi:glycine betaine/choline ABC-type transport system substrate-binding protein